MLSHDVGELESNGLELLGGCQNLLNSRQFSSPKANDMCYDLFQEWHHSFPLRISNPFSKLITVSWIRFDHLLNILPKSIIEDIFIHEHTDLDSRRSSF
jgi:hypothetical protein